jgi:hypothetical protein
MDPHKQQHHWPPAERIHRKISHSIHLYPLHSEWFRSSRNILILSLSAAAKHRDAMPNPLPKGHRRNVCDSICSWFTLTVPSAINSNKSVEWLGIRILRNQFSIYQWYECCVPGRSSSRMRSKLLAVHSWLLPRICSSYVPTVASVDERKRIPQPQKVGPDQTYGFFTTQKVMDGRFSNRTSLLLPTE